MWIQPLYFALNKCPFPEQCQGTYYVYVKTKKEKEIKYIYIRTHVDVIYVVVPMIR